MKTKPDIEFSVATNWDPKLLHGIQDYPIHSIYGKLKFDILGGGRNPQKLPVVTPSQVEEHVKQAREQGIEFFYLLNTNSTNNKEFTPQFHKQIYNQLEWLSKIGTDRVTIALPFLAKIVKENFPNLKIHVSKMARVSTAKRAMYWAEMGAASVCLDTYITRNFDRLAEISDSVDLELELLANDACLFQCPYDNYHNATESNVSQENTKTSYFSYCTFSCKQKFWSNPSEIIRSMFIRPEDLQAYSQVGIKRFKLIDRIKPTEWMLNMLKAYSEQKYDGNLADLFGFYNTYQKKPENQKPKRLKPGQAKSFAQIRRLKSSNYFNLDIFIDNNKLDGFLNHFKKQSCEQSACGIDCKYCAAIAKKAIKINKKNRDTILANLKLVLGKFHKGQLT